MKFFVDNLYLFAIALVSGGLLLWPLIKRGGASASVVPAVATQLINQHNAIVVDVRDEAAFATGSVTGARHLPLASIAERASDLARFKTRPVIVVCATGQSSVRAVSALKAQGFDDVRVLAGGLAAWKQAGLPLVLANRDASRTATREGARTKPKGSSRERSRQHRAANASAVEAANATAVDAANEPALDDAESVSAAPADPAPKVKELS